MKMKKVFRKIVSSFLVAVMLFGLLPIMALPTSAVIYSSNGKFLALVESPIAGSLPISSKIELEAIKRTQQIAEAGSENLRNYHLNGTYHLKNDIDLWGVDWIPIENFTGIFDGQGYIINNLTISVRQSNLGLFGSISNAVIKNLGLEYVYINPMYGSIFDTGNIGGIVGRIADFSIINNCYVEGDITIDSGVYSSDTYAGGICGSASSNTTISNCFNNSKVTINTEKIMILNSSVFTSHSSISYAGGICGIGGVVINCYNTGKITSSSCSDVFSWPYIIDSGSLTSTSYAGGIAGSSYSVDNCYNEGEIFAISFSRITAGSPADSSSRSISTSYAGGIVGFGNFGDVINNCYNKGYVSSDSHSQSSYNNTGFDSSVSRTSYVGGINGFGSFIHNCYNIGGISATTGSGFNFDLHRYSYAGSISGSSNNISDCYWNVSSTQIVDSGLQIPKRGVGFGTDATQPLTPEEMENPANFVNFDFETVWGCLINGDYKNPVLRVFHDETDVFLPTFTRTLNIHAPIFDAVTEGYTRPAAKNITITNTGNSTATISSVTISPNAAFDIGGSGATVPAGGSINTWTVQPKTGLAPGTYNTTVTVAYDGTNGTTTTADVSFTVNTLVYAQIPIITTQPQNANVNVGITHDITVEANITDDGTLSYQWYRNTVNNTSDGIPVGTNSNIYAAPIDTAGTFYYYVVVTNTNDGVNGGKIATTTSDIATVTVNPLVHAQTPIITTQPQNATVNVGITHDLSVVANVANGGILSYQWYRNTTNSISGSNLVGDNSSIYAAPIDTVGTYYYYVVVTNTNDSVNGNKIATATSDIATVTVIPPTILSGKCGDDLTWTFDGDGLLQITGTGDMWDWESNWLNNIFAPWFGYRDSIKIVFMPESVTKIGKRAFLGCYSLTNIEIPDSVASIGDSAFSGCSSLQSVKLPDNVDFTSIGSSVFWYCQSLESIEIPDSVKSVGDSAFDHCHNLESVKFPDNKDFTVIGEYAFGNCRSLESVEIPDSVTSIGRYSFFGCTSLLSVKLSKNMDSIGPCAFIYCTSLESITIPTSVTSIGYSAFANCNNLYNAQFFSKIPPVVDDTYAFQNVKSGARAIVPATWGDYGIEEGSLWNGLIVVYAEINIIDSGECGGNLTWTLDKNGLLEITGIGNMWDWPTDTDVPWDSYKENIKTVIISDGVTSIGNYAFYGCGDFERIEIPKSVISIGGHAFDNCNSSLTIDLPAGLASNHPLYEFFCVQEMTEGYVTAVPNWSAVLEVLYQGEPVTLTPSPLQAANTPFAGYSDICVSFCDRSYKIITTMDRIGLGAYKADPLALLGLKITLYIGQSPDFNNVRIPAIIHGTKTEIDIEEVDGAFNTGNSGVVDRLSIPFPAINGVVMSREDLFAAPVANLYTFDDSAIMTGVIGTNVAMQQKAFADTKYLAQKAGNKTNYRLELVYNGLYPDGTPEYFYIFRPFRVGVYTQDVEAALSADKPMVFTTSVVKVDATSKQVRHAANFVNKTIGNLTPDKAYLYTYYGANLEIYAELTEDVGAIPVAANMTAKVVTFKLPGGNKDVYFNSGDPKALGAWDNAYNITPNGKSVHTIYYDGNAALLARRTNDGPDEYQKSEYVVILSLSAMREVTLRDPDTHERIGQGYRAIVLNAQTGETEDIVIHLVDGAENDYWANAVGTPVRLVNKHFDYYDVATRNHVGFISHVAGKEYAGYKAVPTISDFNANCVTLTQIWPWPSGIAYAYIDADTNVVVWNTVSNSAAHYTGDETGLAYLKEVIGWGSATDLIVAGLGSPMDGTAGFVYVKTTGTIIDPPPSPDDYAMVLDYDSGIIYGGYYFGTARMANGSTINVASNTPGAIVRGNLVSLSDDKVNAFGVEYTVAKLLDSKLDVTTIGEFDSFFSTVPADLNYDVDNGKLRAKGGILDVYSYYQDHGFDLGSNFYRFDRNSFKVVVAYTAGGSAVLVTDGRPTAADPNVKDQFISISQTEYHRIMTAGGKIYLLAYTIGDGTPDETVVFATMLIDLRDVTLANATSAGWRNAANSYKNPFGWSDEGLWTTIIASGECGDNVTWTLDGNGLLEIIGTGDMWGWEIDISVPWYDWRESIKTVVISDGVKSIGATAFYCCFNLESIKIPDSITSIGDFAFAHCTSLPVVNIPKNVIYLSNYAFLSCHTLESINIDNNNPHYVSENGIVYNREKNILLRYPEGKTATQFTIPNGVEQIGPSAFNCCENLENVVIPNSVAYIGTQAFSSCKNLTSITIPNSVESFGTHIFDACLGLASVTFENPSKIAFIPDYMFSSCINLVDIEIPDSVTSIGDYAFSYCINLTSVIFEGNAPILGENVFGVYDQDTGSYKPIPGFTIYYYEGTTGWTNPWNGYTTVMLPRPGGEMPTIAVGKVNAIKGGIVTVPVTIDKNPGLSDVNLRFEYDPDLTLLEFVTDTTTMTLDPVTNIDTKTVLLSDPTPNGYTGNTLVLLKFQVSPNAEPGEKPITILKNGSGLSDKNAEMVAFDVSPGHVNVVNVIYGDVNGDGEILTNDLTVLRRYFANWPGIMVSPGADVNGDGEVLTNDLTILRRYFANWPGIVLGPNTQGGTENSIMAAESSISSGDGIVLTVGTVEGKRGEYIDVPITIDNNPGLSDAPLEIHFDDGLTLTEFITDATTMTLDMVSDVDYKTALLTDPTANGFTGTTLIILRFLVGENATPGMKNISVSTTALVDKNAENIFPGIIPGGILVPEESTTTGYSVTGKAKTYNPNNAVTLTLTRDSDGKAYTTTIGATAGSGQVTQDFAFAGVEPGTYTLTVAKPGHLRFTVRDIVVGGAYGGAELPTVTLLCGDITGDNFVNAADLAVLLENFGRSGSDIADSAADLTGDGIVNASDLAILLENFGK